MTNISDLAVRARWYGPQGVMNFTEKTHGPQFDQGVWRSCPLLAVLCNPSIGSIFRDDFFNLDTTLWTTVEDAGAGGTDGVQDQSHGVYRHYCDGDDNDEAYLVSQGESWLFTANHPVWFEAGIILTESATDKANFIIGLMDAAAADALVDNGGGPAASYDGALWFKRDSNMYLEFETSNAATQVTTADLAAHTSGTYYRVGFVFDPRDGTTGAIIPYLDDVPYTEHAITLAGLAEMEAIFGVKAGSGAEEYIEIDYMMIVKVGR